MTSSTSSGPTRIFLDSNIIAKPVTRTLLMVGGAPSDFRVEWSLTAEQEATAHMRRRAVAPALMASNPYDPTAAGFDTRYARWVAAQESGDEVETKAAADLPTLNARVRAKLAAVDETVTDPEDRAAQKRLVLLVSEIRAHEAARQRERRKAAQRRHDRTVRLSRTVELPTTCARCGNKLDGTKSTGRPRVYCSPACPKAAYEDRRAHRDDAVKVQVVEKVVTEIRERHIEVPHPRNDCVRAVLADDEAMLAVIGTLAALVRDHSRSAYDPEQPMFQNLRYHVEGLQDALIRRAEAGRSEPDFR